MMFVYTVIFKCILALTFHVVVKNEEKLNGAIQGEREQRGFHYQAIKNVIVPPWYQLKVVLNSIKAHNKTSNQNKCHLENIS